MMLVVWYSCLGGIGRRGRDGGGWRDVLFLEHGGDWARLSVIDESVVTSERQRQTKMRWRRFCLLALGTRL